MVCAQIEQEIAELEDDEKKMFLEDLIHIPGKDYIINPRPDNRKYYSINCQVIVILRILLCPLCLQCCNTDGLLAMRLPVDAVRGSDITELMRKHMETEDGVSYIQAHPTFLYESPLTYIFKA